STVHLLGHHSLNRQNPYNHSQTLAHERKDEAVIPPETLAEAHRLHKKQRKNVAFRESPTARAETYIATAILAPIGLANPRIGGISHRSAPQKNSRRRGGGTE